jgi:predicted phosphodiesterase
MEYLRRVRLLCISDIHGQAHALACVLAAAERLGYEHLLVAGDLCFPGPEPLEVWRRLKAARAVMVQGVADRAVASVDPTLLVGKTDHEKARLEQLRRARADLGPGVLAQLQALPPTARLTLPDGGELLLVHGSPADPTEPMSHDMSDDELRALVGDDPADIVVCGGSHVPFDRMVMGVRIVNVGSVGEACAPGHGEATLIVIHEGEVEVRQLVVPTGIASDEHALA